MRSLIFCVALAACGGIIDTGDGGNGGGGGDSGGGGTDGATKKDVITIDVGTNPPNCSPIQSTTAIDSNGGCQSTATWSCGTTKYSVECDCPSAQCSCSQEQNGMGSGTVTQVPSFCPKCDGTQLPTICGFPTN
jgi:hypothetical protein